MSSCSASFLRRLTVAGSVPPRRAKRCTRKCSLPWAGFLSVPGRYWESTLRTPVSLLAFSHSLPTVADQSLPAWPRSSTGGGANSGGLRSHGLPRSSGRHAQIRVSGLSPLAVKVLFSFVTKQSTEADHIRARPTRHDRPIYLLCPKFACPCLWCACLPLGDRCLRLLRGAHWTGHVRTSRVWSLAILRDLWSPLGLGQRGVRRLERRAAFTTHPRHR